MLSANFKNEILLKYANIIIAIMTQIAQPWKLIPHSQAAIILLGLSIK
jgi:hypothetical protein